MIGCIAPHSRITGAACGRPCAPGSEFCSGHVRASPGKRGGWVSAERRRQRMAQHEVRLDASRVANRLWVGGRPPFDRDLPDFDLLVLCAEELQPQKVAFRGNVFRCPLPDATLDIQQLTSAVLAARGVGDALLAGHRVLVTCAAGLNRSAFVASMAIARTTRMTAQEIITLIRTKRGDHALSNQYFCQCLKHIVRR